MKIVSGHLAPTRGVLKLDGAPVELKGPVDAERRGIVLVHQEIMLAPDLTIAENMFLGREARRGFRVDDREMNRRATEAMGVFGVDAPVDRSGRAPVDRSAPTGADRPGADGPPPRRDLRRADRLADADRDDRASQTHSRTEGQGRRGPLHFPSPRGGEGGRRHRHGSARRQEGDDAAQRRSGTRRHGPPDGRARPSRALSSAPAGRRPGRRRSKSRISARKASPRTRASAFGREKFSASPGWSARDAPNCSKPCSGCARAAARSGSTGGRSTGRTRAPACAPGPSI